MHNPNKSKVLCVLAKASYWSLSVLGWTLLFALTAFLIGGLGYQAYTHWSWVEIWNSAKVVGVLLIALAIIVLLVWGLTGLHKWAKNYRENC